MNAGDRPRTTLEAQYPGDGGSFRKARPLPERGASLRAFAIARPVGCSAPRL